MIARCCFDYLSYKLQWQHALRATPTHRLGLLMGHYIPILGPPYDSLGLLTSLAYFHSLFGT